MPLQWQVVPVVFSGLDSHTDDKTSDLRSLLTLENAIIDNPMRIAKRNGYSALSRTIRASGAPLDDVKRIVKRDAIPLALAGWNGTPAVQYSAAAGEWDSLRSALSGPVSMQRIQVQVPSPADPLAKLNTEIAVAYKTGVPGYNADGSKALIAASNGTTSYWCLYDMASGEQWWTNGATANRAHAVAVGKWLCLFTHDVTDLKLRIWDASGDLQSSSSMSLATDISITDPIYDVKVDWTQYAQPRLVVAYRSWVTGTVSLKLMTIDPAASSITSTGQVTGAYPGGTPKVIGWLDTSHSGNSGHSLAVQDANFGLAYVSLSAGLSLYTADTIDSNTTGGGYSVKQVTGLEHGGKVAVIASGKYPELGAHGGAINRDVTAHYSFSPWISGSPPSTVTKTLTLGTDLKSKVRCMDSTGEMWSLWVTDASPGSGAVAQEQENQHDYLLTVTIDGINQAPHALMCVGSSEGEWPSASWLTNIDSDGSDLYVGLAEVIAGKTANLDMTVCPIIGRMVVSSIPGRCSEVGGSAFVPGGTLRLVDGAHYQGHPLPQYPRKPYVTAAAGGSLSGTFQWRCVYRWIDAHGNLWRSAPSQSISLAMGGGGNGTAKVYCHSLTLTDYPGQVSIELYRAPDASNIYKLVSISTNDPTDDNIMVEDAGADVEANETLYTSGGELEHHVPPPSSTSVVWRRRLWLAYGDTLWYSKEIREGFGVHFNGDLTIRIPGEDITALAVMDDRLIIFKRSGIWVLTGDGPDDTGQGYYPEPQLIAPTTGTLYPRAVAETPDGVMFVSVGSGIWCLTRGLGLQFLGDKVEKWTSGAFAPTDAVVIQEANQVRWHSHTGGAWVWDWHHKQWYVWFNWPGGQGATHAGGVTYMLNDDGDLAYVEVSGLATDEAMAGYPTAIATKIRAAHIAVAGLRGFQRVRSIQFLGQWQSSTEGAVVTAAVTHDHSDTRDQYANLAIADTQSVIELRPSRQKCSALSVELYDSEGSTFKLSAISIEVGIKAGRGRLPAASRMT